jgi:hypothetical protein
MAIYRKKNLYHAVRFNGTPVWDENPACLSKALSQEVEPKIKFGYLNGFPTLHVSTPSGTKVAVQGDYLVFEHNGDIEVMSQKDFNYNFEKATL